MPPLNPFLAAFFRSPLPAQCSPVHHHVLLVPTTEFLLTSREVESGASSASSSNDAIIQSEEFLASHVLRAPGAAVAPSGAKDVIPNLREVRNKAKQYATLNGRSLVIKDGQVYTNKGFKSLAQAQLLHDVPWYPDLLEPRQWLIYYISRPLVGTWEEIKITPAILVEGAARKLALEQSRAAGSNGGESTTLPRKKDIKSFHDLLNHFPLIARQMHPGLEKLFLEFRHVLERPLPPPPSADSIPDPIPHGPIRNAVERARSDSLSLHRSKPGQPTAPLPPVMDHYYMEDDEDIMRTSLETAVTTAIDLFQGVDKQQLSMLGATTDLTGPLVERLIERYVTENVHHLIFPRLATMKRPYDLELEAKIRQMEYIDLSQLGIGIEGGSRVKHELTIHLGLAVEEFKKMSHAASPQEMLGLLLSTTKLATQLTDIPGEAEGPDQERRQEACSEKPTLMVNADTLVSLLLFVVIRAQVRNLQARLSYIRHFIFIDDVENGEMGYALSTFEAVLTYLAMDSGGLRKASRRNKALWDATRSGRLVELQKIMEPSGRDDSDDDEEQEPEEGDERPLNETDEDSCRFSPATTAAPPPPPFSHHSPSRRNSVNGPPSRTSSITFSSTDRFSLGSGLHHVFPFQHTGNGAATDGDLSQLPTKRVKRVAMDTRSMSSGSEMSYHSTAGSLLTVGSALEGDISVERLAQTHNSFGESVLMMAVQNERPDVLRYLLSLEEYYPFQVVLDDINNEDTTLLSAAVQLGHTELIDMILDFVTTRSATPDQVRWYLARQDIWGRSCAHYLFHAPCLIGRIGGLVPWRQRDKNGQTPLFALCRSYDHADYVAMVQAALDAAVAAQGDGLPLHVDDHVDNKGNTLLHIVHEPQLLGRILHESDVDVNATTHERRFTPLMVASKYGRLDMVRALYADARVDTAAREFRGLTAVELAKDDEVRNLMDGLALFKLPPAGSDKDNARVSGVVRAYFVEDATVRLVLKSAVPAEVVESTVTSYTVTTTRRSLSDFEQLSRLLAMENPASWIPAVGGPRSPFQIPSRPSRAVLRDIQMRADWFLRIMLAHPTFSTHEMLWEFLLVPDMQLDMMDQRSRLKAEARAEKVREEMEPVEDVREVEQFAGHAREMIRSLHYATRNMAKRANAANTAASDLHDAAALLHKAVSTLDYLPQRHITAFESYVRTLAPSQLSPWAVFHHSVVACQLTAMQALLSALARPGSLVSQMAAMRKAMERNHNSLNRSTRWPLGLLDDTRQRLQEDREEKARQSQEQLDDLGRELRYTQQVVAAELAGFQEVHQKMGRRAIRDFARGMVVQERMRLEGMTRLLRKLRAGERRPGEQPAAEADNDSGGEKARVWEDGQVPGDEATGVRADPDAPVSRDTGEEGQGTALT